MSTEEVMSSAILFLILICAIVYQRAIIDRTKEALRQSQEANRQLNALASGGSASNQQVAERQSAADAANSHSSSEQSAESQTSKTTTRNESGTTDHSDENPKMGERRKRRNKDVVTMNVRLRPNQRAWMKEYDGWELSLIQGGAYMEHLIDMADTEREWIAMPHPMCRAHSTDPTASASALYEFLNRDYISHFGRVVGFQDHLDYDGTYGASGDESADELHCKAFESYSYHDGGGGWSESVTLTFIESAKRPKSLRHGDKFRSGEPMPPNEGYWVEDGTLYLLNPFHMQGVFAFRKEKSSWDLDITGEDNNESVTVDMPPYQDDDKKEGQGQPRDVEPDSATEH